MQYHAPVAASRKHRQTLRCTSNEFFLFFVREREGGEGFWKKRRSHAKNRGFEDTSMQSSGSRCVCACVWYMYVWLCVRVRALVSVERFRLCEEIWFVISNNNADESIIASTRCFFFFFFASRILGNREKSFCGCLKLEGWFKGEREGGGGKNV